MLTQKADGSNPAYPNPTKKTSGLPLGVLSQNSSSFRQPIVIKVYA